MFYHATVSELEIGKTITSRSSKTTDINLIFDRLCPHDCVGRVKALFTGGDAAFCAAFLSSETSHENKDVKIYRVEVSNPSKHPMCLVSYAMFFLKDESKLTAIIQEYWKPTLDWKCLEYTVSSIIPTIAEQTPDQNTIAGAKFRYGQDIRLAKKIWPRP